MEESMATYSRILAQSPIERGAWQAMVHRVAKSWTRLKQLSMQITESVYRTNIALSIKYKVKFKKQKN